MGEGWEGRDMTQEAEVKTWGAWVHQKAQKAREATVVVTKVPSVGGGRPDDDVPVVWQVDEDDPCSIGSDIAESFGSVVTDLKSVTDDVKWTKVLKHHCRLMALQTMVHVLGQTEHTGDLESMIEERGRVWY